MPLLDTFLKRLMMHQQEVMDCHLTMAVWEASNPSSLYILCDKWAYAEKVQRNLKLQANELTELAIPSGLF